MKKFINTLIDAIFETKWKPRVYRELTNVPLKMALEQGYMFAFCILNRDDKNIVAKAIRKVSGGPVVHYTTVINKYKATYFGSELARLTEKIKEYYGKFHEFRFVTLASAEDNGMRYSNASIWQNREMAVFCIAKEYEIQKSGQVTSMLLSKKMMRSNYDFMGLVGHAFKKISYVIYRWFDDDSALYCSEQADLIKKCGITICDKKDPNPTEIYRYLKDHYQLVYSSLKEEI